MKNIKALFASAPRFYKKPWLIVGKGPSYKLIDTLDTSEYNVLTLNHVIRQQQAAITHLMDVDVFDACANEIYNQAEFLVMPYYPHSDHLPGKFSLPELIRQWPILQKIDQENRLFWYDHLGLKALRFGSRPIKLVRQFFVHSFSAEAALAILALNNIKTIRTVGIDGGAHYNEVFADSDPHTLLANGRASFDEQFHYMKKIIIANNLDFQAISAIHPHAISVATDDQ